MKGGLISYQYCTLKQSIPAIVFVDYCSPIVQNLQARTLNKSPFYRSFHHAYLQLFFNYYYKQQLILIVINHKPIEAPSFIFSHLYYVATIE